jgi:hypothetical protein
MYIGDPVNWVNGLEELTDREKEAVLSKNATALLGLSG